VIVASDNQPHVVFAEERHVQASDGRRRRLQVAAAMRTRRKRRMVKERDHVTVAVAIEMLELIGHPRELHVIGRDVGIERDQERVAEPDRVRRIGAQSPRRAFGRDQPR
jgi:hypothetical protein